jgi:membrane protein
VAVAHSRAAGRFDDLQRRHARLAFCYAVVRKYLDDGGAREAALITYYGFLSLFPVLLLGSAVVSRIFIDSPGLRQDVVAAIVPPSLRADVAESVAVLTRSPAPLIVGLIGLVYSGTGVVFSAYLTLNHLAAVPLRDRRGLVSRLLRVFAGLAVILAGAIAAGLLTVAVAAAPHGLSRALGLTASCLVSGVVLTVLARLLLDRPAPLRSLWPAALSGAVAVTATLNVGAVVLPRLVRGAGLVYGGFATVAGVFTLLYVLSNVLVLSAEVAAVRHGRLWPRALGTHRPTTADRRALDLLTREQDRGRFTRQEQGGEEPDHPDDGHGRQG